jgi:hypothetical protein
VRVWWREEGGQMEGDGGRMQRGSMERGEDGGRMERGWRRMEGGWKEDGERMDRATRRWRAGEVERVLTRDVRGRRRRRRRRRKGLSHFFLFHRQRLLLLLMGPVLPFPSLLLLVEELDLVEDLLVLPSFFPSSVCFCWSSQVEVCREFLGEACELF